MILCWCGCVVDDKGFHLGFPAENGWSNSYFVRDGDGGITHHREKPQRGAPSPQAVAETAK